MARGILIYQGTVDSTIEWLDELFINPGVGFSSLKGLLYYRDEDIRQMLNLRPLVTVNGGRKWNGVGYLVGYIHETYMGWGSLYGMIYDPVTNLIFKVTAKYVSFHESYMNGFCNHVRYVMNNKLSLNPDSFQLDHRILDCNTEFVKYLQIIHQYREIEIPKDAKCVEEEVKKAKEEQKKAEFKAVKFPELIKWAESKGKVGQEAIDLAEKVWQKNYA